MQGGKKLRSSTHIKTEPASAGRREGAEEEEEDDDVELVDELDDEVEVLPFTRNARQTRLQQRLTRASQPARAGKGSAEDPAEGEDDESAGDEVQEHPSLSLLAHPGSVQARSCKAQGRAAPIGGDTLPDVPGMRGGLWHAYCLMGAS